ncbi:MAG: LOG family protein [Nitrospina sp.]|nr:LOG family protein [Nitrospina sp.]
MIDALVEFCGPEPRNRELIREILTTSVKIGREISNRGELKLINSSLKEMRYALKLFCPFEGTRRAVIFGSARTPETDPHLPGLPDVRQDHGRERLMVITGAGDGIMAAAHEGAGYENSLGFNITLPFEQHANKTVHGTSHVLPFHFFFLRKLFFVKEADGLVLCPGGFGTLDEALEVMTLIQTGKSPLVPVVLLDAPEGRYWLDALAFMQTQLRDNGYISASDLKLIRIATTPQQAAEEITGFYRNFHSSRWLKDTFVIRMNHALNEQAIAELKHEFADLCNSHGFTQQPYSSSEADEPEFSDMIRLAFHFNGRDHGRLRELVDFINQPQHWKQ